MASRRGWIAARLALALCVGGELEAARSAEKPAAPSEAAALLKRANYYRSALSKEQDPVLAFRWMQEAARKGLPAAQYELARMLLEARGAPFDLAQAKAWLRKAAPKDKRAAALLSKVEATPPLPPTPIPRLAAPAPQFTLNPTAVARNGAGSVVDAAARGDLRALEALLQAGASVDDRDADGNTALMAAAAAGQLEAARLLVTRGADRNAKNVRHATALTLATGVQHPQLAALLLDDANEIDRNDLSAALFVAATNCDEATTRLLINRGARANPRQNGQTPLMRAAVRCPAAIADILARDPIDAADKWKRTALWIAAQSGNTAIVATALAKGAAREAMGVHGATPLIAALEQRHEETALLLMRSGANVSARTAAGETPLIAAAHAGLKEAVEEALDRGADPNARDALGVSALMTAARQGHAEIVTALLAKGADPRLRNKKRETAHDLAADDRLRSLLTR